MSIVEQGAAAPSARAIAWLASGLGVIGLILPLFTIGPHGDHLAAAALILPPAAFGLMLCAPEAFAAKSRRSNVRSLNILPGISVMGLAISGSQTGYLDWTIALVPAALCAAIALLLGLGLAGPRWPVNIGFAAVFLALFGGGYGYGAMVFADRVFDHGPGQIFQATIERQYLSYGRHSTTPHLVLAPWGPSPGQTDVAVSRRAYDALQPGQTACVTLHPGLLRMPWFTADLCDPS